MSGAENIPVPGVPKGGYGSSLSYAPSDYASESGVCTMSDHSSADIKRWRITVTTPVKAEAVDGKVQLPYFLWRVSRIELATSRHSSVNRRYRDFLRLRMLLARGWPGVVLPALPPKDIIQGKVGGVDFMQQRRIGLQRFLGQLASLPLLGQEPEAAALIDAFYEKQVAPEAPEGEWAAGLQPAAVIAASGEGLGFAEIFRWCKEKTTEFRQSYTQAGRNEAAVADPDFESLRAAVGQHKTSLYDTHRRLDAEQHAAAAQRMSQAGLGRALQQLADIEQVQPLKDPSSLARDQTRSLGMLATVLIEKLPPSPGMIGHLDTPPSRVGPNLLSILQAQLEASEGVSEALELRAVLLAAKQSRRAEADDKRAEDIASGKSATQEPSSELEDAAAAAEHEYESCRSRMASELANLAIERADSYRASIRRFATDHLEWANKSAACWRELLDQLDEVDVASTS